MTTYTIYASADHIVYCNDAVYTNARSGAGSKTYNSTDTYNNIGYNHSNAFRQAFFSFNTSTAGTETPGEQVVFSYYCGANVGTATVKVGETTWSGGTGDFIAGASLTGLSLFGSSTPTASTRADISKGSSVTRTSAYKVMMWGTSQESATSPGTSKYVGIYFIEESGTTNDPYMTITIPPVGTLTASIGEFGVSGAAGAKASATGGGSIGEITSAAIGVNLARGTMAASVGDITSAGAASMLVPVNTSQDRRFNFDASTLADRTFSLNA